MKKMSLLLKIPLILVALAALYVIGVIIFATLTDWKPEEKITIETTGKGNKNNITDSVFTIYNWNIGYCGLGAECNFFYDGGDMVRPKKDFVDKYFKGVSETVRTWKDADFIFLQEVDVDSKRSYGLKQAEKFSEQMNQVGFNASLAYNYKVKYVPKPYTEPMGRVNSGIITFSKFDPTENTRHQFSSKFPWPVRLFMLDRCMLLQRYPLQNGKELVVINHHLSAYDNTGELKAAEMNYMKTVLLEEYKKGNYIVVGGDWNQCPPDYDPYTKMTKAEAAYEQSNIPKDWMPATWTFAYDSTVTTNRKVKTAYEPGKTYTTVIDFFLVSPNIKVETIKGIDLQFKNSDHQPVMLQFKLR